MKKYVNGKYMEMTKEEIAELKARMPVIPEQTDNSTDKRLEKLEKKLSKLFDKLGIDLD